MLYQDENNFSSDQTGSGKDADLHTHSLFSDGILHPRRIVGKAIEAGLCAVSITDHDSVDGLDEAIEEGRLAGIEVIPGVELTAHEDHEEIHILGYLIDHQHPEFRNQMTYLRQQRLIRYQKILYHLKNAGIRFKPEVLECLSSQPSIGRLHIAEALVQCGATTNIQNAFRYYLGKGAPAYEEKTPISCKEIISLIHQAGGIAVLAHPSMHLREKLLITMIHDGLDGIETLHPKLNESSSTYFRRLAHQYGLVETGGSDSHGRKGFPEIGDYRLSYDKVEILKKRKKEKESISANSSKERSVF